MRILFLVILLLALPLGALAKNIALTESGATVTSGVPLVISPDPVAGSQATTLVFTISNTDTSGTNLNITSLGVVWGINTAFDSITVDGTAISPTAANNTYEIAPSGSIALSVTYTPTAVGQFGAMIDIESDSDTFANFSLQFAGNAIANPEIELRHNGSAVLDGGTSAITSSPTPGILEAETVTIQNLGTSALTIDYTANDSANTSNAEILSVAASKSTLLAGETAQLSIVYAASNSGAFSLGLLVYSNDLDEALYNISLTGTASNRTPQANAGPDQLVSSGVVVTLDAGASVDPDGNSLGYTWVILSDPTGLVTLNDDTIATPTFTAPQVWNTQEIVFRVTASDGLAQSFDEVSIFVAPGVGAELEVFDSNGDPRASGSAISISTSNYTNTPATQTITLVNNGSASLVLTNTNASALSNVAVISVIPSAASIAPAGLIFMNISFFPLAPGDFSFDITLSSNDADESSYVLSFSGTASNRAPIANAGSDLSTQSGETVVLRATDSSDPDGANLSYVWEQLSGPGVTITNATSEVAEFVAPVVDTTTELIFRVSVDDLIDSSVDDVIVTVSPVPLPEIEILSDTNAAIPDGTALNIEPNPDSDGTPAQEVLTIKNTGAAILTLSSLLVQNQSNVTVTDLALASTSVLPGDTTTVTITYAVASKGAFSIDLDILSDDPDEGIYDILLQGASNNQAPVASAGADQTVIEGETVQLSAVLSVDADNDTLTFSWQQTAGPEVLLSGVGVDSPVFTAPSVFEETLLTFQVTVSDGTATARDEVSVVVLVSTERSHLAVVSSLSSVINQHMVRSSAGIVSSRTRSRLMASKFQDLQNLGAFEANLDEIDTFLMEPDIPISGDTWVRFTSDDLLRSIQGDRTQRLAETLGSIGSDYRLGADPIDSFLAGKTTGLDTYSAFGIGRYTRKGSADYDGLGGYISLGADYLFQDTLLIGGSFTAETNSLTFQDEQNGSLQKAGSRVNLYAGFYFDDLMYFEANVGTGGYVNQIEANFSKGETNSKRFDTSAKIGLNYAFDTISASPWGQINYSRETFDAYQTSDLTAINGFDVKTGSGAFGLDLRTTAPLWGVLQPYATLGLSVDLTSANDSVLSNGVAFEPRSLEGSSSWGARFLMNSSTNSQIYADLNVYRKGDFQNASITDLNLKLGISW
jgi:hypothetical protein